VDSDEPGNQFVGGPADRRQNCRSSSERLRPIAETLSRLVVQWRFFFGACFLTGALVLPYARPEPVLAGMAFAGLLRLAWFRVAGRQDPHQ
jgi:hypothetical protein